MERIEKTTDYKKEVKENLDKSPNIILAYSGKFDALTPELKQKIENIKKTGLNVDWNASQDELDKKDMINDFITNQKENRSYIISPIDNRNKYSENYFLCVGIVAVGKSITGENISFISHQNTNKNFNKNIEARFNIIMAKQLNLLKDQTIPGSIDVIFFGGHYPINPEPEKFDEIPIPSNMIDDYVVYAHVFKKLKSDQSYMNLSHKMDNEEEACDDNEKEMVKLIAPVAQSLFLARDIAKSQNFYAESFSKMRDLILSSLHIEPRMVIGPKTEINSTIDTKVYFSTKDRSAYIVQD